MTLKTALIIAIIALSALSAGMIICEYLTDREARKAAEKEIRQRDMAARDERLKKELIAHNREQLALEYLNKKH